MQTFPGGCHNAVIQSGCLVARLTAALMTGKLATSYELSAEKITRA